MRPALFLVGLAGEGAEVPSGNIRVREHPNRDGQELVQRGCVQVLGRVSSRVRVAILVVRAVDSSPVVHQSGDECRLVAQCLHDGRDDGRRNVRVVHALRVPLDFLYVGLDAKLSINEPDNNDECLAVLRRSVVVDANGSPLDGSCRGFIVEGEVISNMP